MLIRAKQDCEISAARQMIAHYVGWSVGACFKTHSPTDQGLQGSLKVYK